MALDQIPVSELITKAVKINRELKQAIQSGEETENLKYKLDSLTVLLVTHYQELLQKSAHNKLAKLEGICVDRKPGFIPSPMVTVNLQDIEDYMTHVNTYVGPRTEQIFALGVEILK